MKILQVCHKPPFPAVEGGAIAMYNLAKGLKQNHHHVDVIAMNTHKQFCDPNSLKFPLDFCENYTLIDVDIKLKIVPAFLNLFSKKSYNINRFQNPSFEEALFDLVKNEHYDSIILESLFSSFYIDQLNNLFNGKIILRSHNVEFQIWENLAKGTSNPIKKWYLKLLAKRLKKYEIETTNKVDLVACISHDDIEDFKKHQCTSNFYHLKFGIDFEKLQYDFNIDNEELKIYHVGSMNWKPHQEAFQWFFDSVWPGIRELNNCKVYLAGAFMPKWIENKAANNLEVKAGYFDGAQYMKDKHILIVPSFSGSGIRIKIIEAMACGKVVLTNWNGTVGIDAENGQNILVSDAPNYWIQKIEELSNQAEELIKISIEAHKYAKSEHDYIKIAQEFVEKLKEMR